MDAIERLDAWRTWMDAKERAVDEHLSQPRHLNFDTELTHERRLILQLHLEHFACQ